MTSAPNRALASVTTPDPKHDELASADNSPPSEAAAAVRGLFGRDSVYLALWAVQLGAAALFTPVSTRLLGPSRFGLVVAAIAVMQVLVAMGSLSLQTAVQRQYASPNGERNARRLLALAIGCSVLIALVADLTGPSWTVALGLGRYPLALRFAVGWASLTAISNAMLGLLRSRDQLLPFATISLVQSVVAEGLSLFLLLAVRRTAAEYVLGHLLAQALAVVAGLTFARPLPVRWRDLRMARGALRYSVPLVPGALASFVLEASDRLVIQHDLGSTAVARYGVAYNIGAIPILLLGLLNTVWMPRVFELGITSVRDTVLTQSRDALYALLIPVAVGLGIGAPLLLHIWAPASYTPDKLRLLVVIVGATSIFVAGAMSETRVLLAEGRTAPVAATMMLAAAANLGLNVLLVPSLGIEGSALATLAGYALLHGALAAAARKARPLRPTSRVLLGEVLTALALAVVATTLPVTPLFIALRLAIVLVCLATFAVMLSTLATMFGARQTHFIAKWMRSRVQPVAT